MKTVVGARGSFLVFLLCMLFSVGWASPALAAPPVVTAVTPDNGPVAGGGTVTLTGTGFTDATEVSFGSESAGFIVVDDTNIVVFSLPAHSAGVVNVIVTTPEGASAATAANQFTYIGLAAPPTITSISPNSGPLAGGTTVILTGTNLTDATAVSFGATIASFAVNSDTQITATSPGGSAGTVNVTVQTAGGTSTTSASTQFTYTAVAAPTVTNVTANRGSTLGGGTVTLTGTNFTGATNVSFGGTSASFVVVSATNIAVTSLPAHIAGVVNVIVTTAGGSSAAATANQFTYIAPPTVDAVSPASGSSAGGTTVVLTGTNFTNATSVRFGAATSSFVVNNATQITATSPTGSVGTVNITVRTVGGTSAIGAANQFTYVAPPTVTDVLANRGSTLGGGTVTLTGTNFTGATDVSFGGASASFVVVDDTNLVVTSLPAHSAGVVNVIVTTPGGPSAAATANQFTYIAPPTVDAVSPNSGSIAGGATVILTGNNFTDATDVRFGAATASFVVNGATQITATSPVGSVGIVNITVRTVGGTSATGAANQFTYAAVPTAAARSVSTAYQTAAAIDLTASITGVSTSVNVASAPTHGTTSVSGNVVTYTPATGYAGPDSFTYAATGPGGTSAPAAVTITVDAPTIILPPVSLPAAMMDAAYSQTLSASGGAAPYGFAVTAGALPAGLALSPAGVIEGTPTVHGSFNFTATVTDSSTGAGPFGAMQSYTLTVSPPLAPVANPVGANIGYGSSANAIALDLSGGAATSVAVVTQPAHGTATASGLTISYTPTAGYAGQDSFTYSASNDGGTSVPATVTIAVASPVVAISPANLIAGQQDAAYSATLVASGGTAPYGFAITAGALPSGLSLATNGTLSGTPTVNGSFAFTATVTDASTGAGPFSAAIAYTLQIAAPAAPVARDAPGTSVSGTTVPNATSVNINLAALVDGNYTDIRIDTQPAHGAVTIAGDFIATYRPAAGYQGSDAFTFIAVGPGGTSSPARVALTVVGAVPVAPSLSVTLLNGRELTLDITSGAAEGPFTSAAVVSITPANALTTELVAGGTPDNRSYGLKLRAIGRFSGSAVVHYTLSNIFGTSQPATVTVMVEARPDPSADPVVRGLSAAQADATRRFASTQLDNFARRNEQLHGDGAGSRGKQLGVRVSGGDAAMYDRNGSVDEGGPGGRNDPGRTVDMRALRGVQTADASPGTSPVLAQLATAGDDATPTGERARGSVELWTGGALQIGTRDATTQRSKLRVSSSGLSAGLDLKVSDALTLGIGGGYGFDRTKVSENNEGRLDAENWVGAVYGSLAPTDGMFVDGVFGIGGLDFDTRRLAPDGATALGRRNGSMLFGSLATGFDKSSDRGRLSLYARGEYMSAKLKAYSETGAGIFNLAFAERKPESFATILGARGVIVVPSSIGLFTPRGRIEWRHEFNRSGAQALDYADIAGVDGLGYGYLIRDDHWLRNEFQIEIGTGLDVGGGWAFGIDVGGRFGAGSTLGTAKVSASTKF